MPPLAYFLTFSTYGTHLPGSGKGWVDAEHAVHGTPVLASNPKRTAYWEAHLRENSWSMDADARSIALEAICSVSIHRHWIAHAIHVRKTHVHAVISGDTAPERMLADFKAYCTRGFRRGSRENFRRHYWTHHGSTRYLWNETSLAAAIEYVVNGQGEKLACYYRNRSLLNKPY